MKYPYSLPSLSYAYDALDPYIDTQTMEIHHTKHHQAYIDALNTALKDHPELQQKSLHELLSNLQAIPETIRTAVQNQGGGHSNHTAFWHHLSPKKDQQPSSVLKQLIERDFSSFEQFQEQFNNAAKTRFGSGWAWLSLDKQDRLVVTSTANQDTPVSVGLRPLVGLDVWEHAYYLKYQNRRVDYIAAWWHILNWEYVQEVYEKIR